MKRFLRPSIPALGWLVLTCLVLPAAAEVVQVDQNAVLYATNYQRGVNLTSLRGAPGKPPASPSTGTDGRAPAGGTLYQFQGVVTYGAVVVPTNNPANPLNTNKSFELNAVALNLPRGTSSGGQVTMVLRSSQAGAATFSQVVSFYFGSIITPPATDENGVLLTNVTPAQYWEAQPYTNATISDAGYYYSPNARQVFATVPGPIQVTWRKFDAGTTSTNIVTIGGLNYALTNVSYVVSGAPVKPSRKMYWTEKSFAGTGKPVSVPAGSVGAVYFAYNPALPQTVAAEFNDGYSGAGAGSTNATLQELRTVWYDPSQGLILAYNAQGRVFMELLGDTTPSGGREFLGYEIVDVFQQPVAQAVTAELGEKIAAYANGQSDADLVPAPVQATLNTTLLYTDSSGTSGRTEYYAAAETKNPNDVLVHWLEAGIVGLRWPLVFNRYQQVWPDDPAKYSHYLRPLVATVTNAALTAVQLSANNAPAIQYQDALDYPRATLDESARFYTFLDASQPTHRTLLRFSSGTTLAFERVLSSLSTNLFRGTNAAFADVKGVIPRGGQASALVLDGTGYGQLPSGVYFTDGSYTVEAWVNVTAIANWSRLMDFGNGAANNNVLLALSSNTSGTPAVAHYSTTSTTTFSPKALGTNQWTHLAAVFDAGTSNLTIYVNGVATVTGIAVAPANVNRTLNYIGKSNWGGDALAKAQMDSFRIWSTARTPEQLQQAMLTNGYPAGTAGLQVQFTFDEGGTVAYDSSGNNRHMTLFGGATLTSAALAQNASPRYLYQTAYVGDRINAPAGELGSTGSYTAGYILQSSGTSFHPGAYVDPFANGFTKANVGAIIPVNVVPGANILEVWWFRQNATNAVKNSVNGFDPIYWPSVIGRYSLAWPADNATNQIVMAGNAGSGALASLQAKATIYTQNDPTLAGYNPNEEHALMIGGQAYALRDDLNVTSDGGFSSLPYVLLDYTEADNRPAMRTFKVLRESPAQGLVFDCVVEAGRQLQAPMPLPLLALPLATVTNLTATRTNIYTTNYNSETSGSGGDLPVGWAGSETNGEFGHYPLFTYRDRKHGFWVMRGVHAGLPTLRAGTYLGGASNDNFTNTVFGKGPLNAPSTNYIHTSRRIDSLVFNVSPALPAGITFGALKDGLAVYGTWTNNSSSSSPYQLSITDGDGSQATVAFTFTSSTNQSPQPPLTIVSTNTFTGTVSTFIGRPPHLSLSATNTNSFAMRFYYKTQAGFAWPNDPSPPTNGTIVPYLRPLASGGFAGTGDTPESVAQPIVYRPVWPGTTLPVAFGETLTVASKGRPAIRGQSSAHVIYQQAIATNSMRGTNAAVTLHDPTRLKSFALKTNASEGLTQLPAGVYAQGYQGKTYFPNLPPHLANRFYFDPNLGSKGSLVFKGEFKDEPTGEKYVQLNVLTNSDLATIQNLCPGGDPDLDKWRSAVSGLTATVETFYENPTIPGQFIVNPLGR